ncbi:hypothetical protein HMI55_005847, partial [Coelomomyces lativittatus]
NAHRGHDLGRRDDLLSLAYVFYEFLNGQLPWRKERNRDKITEMKSDFCNFPQFLTLPEPFRVFYEYLENLEYDSAPDYSLLLDLMAKAFELSGAKPDVRYDWDTEKPKST